MGIEAPARGGSSASPARVLVSLSAPATSVVAEDIGAIITACQQLPEALYVAQAPDRRHANPVDAIDFCCVCHVTRISDGQIINQITSPNHKSFAKMI